jgi:hypothetical protein
LKRKIDACLGILTAEADSNSYEAADAPPQCSICQDALDGDLVVHTLTCGHTLHRACLEGMLPNGIPMFKCPLCTLPIENWDGEQPPDHMPGFATGVTDSLDAPTDVVEQDVAGNVLHADDDLENVDSADWVPGE